MFNTNTYVVKQAGVEGMRYGIASLPVSGASSSALKESSSFSAVPAREEHPVRFHDENATRSFCAVLNVLALHSEIFTWT